MPPMPWMDRLLERMPSAMAWARMEKTPANFPAELSLRMDFDFLVPGRGPKLEQSDPI